MEIKKTGSVKDGESAMEKDCHELLVREKTTIKDVMRKMDKASRKIIFVADRKGRLLGTITDGDIRRWILSSGDLKCGSARIYNRNPVYVTREGSDNSAYIADARKRMFETGVDSIPVVDQAMRIVDIVSIRDVVKDERAEPVKESSLKIPVVIMAGGQGSRLDPFTRVLPKPLIPIGEKPVVEIIIENFLRYTAGDVYLILGHKAEMVRSYFDNAVSKFRLTYIHEGDSPLGTAGGLRLLPKQFPRTFFLSNCDTVITARYDDLYAFHRDNKYDITIVGSIQHHTVPYGVIRINSRGALKAIEEKPEYDFLVNTGMYVIERSVLRFIASSKPFHVTDLIKKVRAHKGRVGVYPVSEKSWFDVGQWESYRKTTKGLIEGL